MYYTTCKKDVPDTHLHLLNIILSLVYEDEHGITHPLTS